jgi:hypothetical protein
VKNRRIEKRYIKMSDTPEADNERFNGVEGSMPDVVTYEFAQKLERERDEARAERDGVAGSMARIMVFVQEVERRAEEKMLLTGKLEGAHYAAMKQVAEEWKNSET